MVQFDHPLKLLVEDESDTEVTKVDSKFAEMVRALEADQQERIVEICKKNQQQ